MNSYQYNSQTGVNEPLPVRVFANIVSYIFHPLFIPAYVTAFLLFVHPYAFAGLDDRMKLLRLLSVLVSTTLLPAFSIFLLWRLDFIQSIFLRTQKERIFAYVISMIFYFWIWYVFKNLESPLAIREFFLGVFLAVCGAWMANIRYKISMHATGVGGLFMFALLQSLQDPAVAGGYLPIAIIITGLVCSARLIIGGHSRFDVYTGLANGALAQLVAVWL